MVQARNRATEAARGTAKARAAAAKLAASKSTSYIKGFVDFVREQGVVGLAVGLAVGTAAGAAVKQIVDGLINPIVGFLIGGIDLNALAWTIIKPHPGKPNTGLTIDWGAILSALITLVATALVIYWLIHVFRLDRLDKKKA